MDRLTFKNGDGVACVRGDQCYEEQSGHYCGSAIDRLADYEDLGMLAEEIVDAVQQDTAQFDPMQALQIVAALDLLNKYQQAERAGRLVILPNHRRRLIWGSAEHDVLLCPACGHDLMGGFPHGDGSEEMVNCPYCGEYVDGSVEPEEGT